MDNTQEESKDVQEELESLRSELAEATTLIGNLYNRVTQLERRVAADAESEDDKRQSDESAANTQQPLEPLELPHTEPTSEGGFQELPDTRRQRRIWRLDWEQVLGRNWFAIIGGIAVVLGIGFFLKLAFDNNWINDTSRIALGIAAGVGFLGVGEYAQSRVPRWAQAVTASGAAILYLSIYAAFGLYQLIRPEVAFLLLAVVVAVAVLLALRYESIVIALLGVVGGFISPLLLGTDLPDKRLVLAYIILIDVGILAISTFRNWRWLTLVGWVGSYSVFVYWLIDFPSYPPVITQIALSGTFLTFAAVTPLFHILWRRVPGASDLSLMSINSIAYFLITVGILSDGYAGWLGIVAFSLAAFYGLVALIALNWRGTSDRIVQFSLAIAIVFLTAAIPLLFTGYTVAISWAAQGAATIWMGFYLGRRQMRAFGIAVLSLTVFHLVLFDFWVDTQGYVPFINGRFSTAAIVIAAFYAAGVIYWRNRNPDSQFKAEQWAMPSMFGIANLLTLVLFSIEAVNLLDRESLGWDSIFDLGLAQNLQSGAHYALTLIWAVYGTVIVAIGLLKNLRLARWGGLAVLGVAVCKLIAFDAIFIPIDLLDFTPLLNIRFLWFALILALLSTLTFWFRRSERLLTAEEKLVFPILLTVSNVVALWMLSQEAIYFFDSVASKYEGSYLNAARLSLTALWAVYGAAVTLASLWRRYAPARWGGLALLGVAVCKLLAYDTLNVRIDDVTFTPLINIRFLTFALVVALLSLLAFVFRRNEHLLTAEEKPIFLILLTASNMVALWMLSQEVIYFLNGLEVRHGSDYFSPMNLSLTVLWAAYSTGVIGAGIHAQSSRIRLAGIGLLAIPVAKLFMFDVFLLDMVYRVVAFITLGCLLLALGLVYQRYSGAVRGFLLGVKPIAREPHGLEN